MIIVTGALGFIGSNMVRYLNGYGLTDILLVDSFGEDDRWKNLVGAKYEDFVDYTDNSFYSSINSETVVIHLGAISSTTERDCKKLWNQNVVFTQGLASVCALAGARFIYASSAATYGAASECIDDVTQLDSLVPLNPYAWSKNTFDIWARDSGMLDRIVGIKPFNVYGPNEIHKNENASVTTKLFKMISEGNHTFKLFDNTDKGYKPGTELRDHVYVKDICSIIYWFMSNTKCGLYNAGTGKSETWNDLISYVSTATGQKIETELIKMDARFNSQYQFKTKASMKKLRDAGYDLPLTGLKEGIQSYWQSCWDKNSMKGYNNV